MDGVEQIAVFFDDCNYSGYCEDVTYYANFGKKSVSAEQLNGWNHIGSRDRSKRSLVMMGASESLIPSANSHQRR